jgi:hypothetical protein
MVRVEQIHLTKVHRIVARHSGEMGVELDQVGFEGKEKGCSSVGTTTWGASARASSAMPA